MRYLDIPIKEIKSHLSNRNIYDYENILGPGTGNINDHINPKSKTRARMNVVYFDVPGYGVLDPAEYGNYLTGWTSAVIEIITSWQYVDLAILAGILYSSFDGSSNGDAVQESMHDELSRPFLMQGYAHGLEMVDVIRGAGWGNTTFWEASPTRSSDGGWSFN